MEYAYTDAAPCCTHSYLLPVIARHLGAGPILDLGCGNGAISHSLLSMGFDVYGVDSSESGVAAANAVNPGRFFVCDINSQLPHEMDRPFAYVISTEVIEHLYDPRALLRVARKALAPGGTLVLSTPYHGYLKNLVLALSGKMDGHFTVLWDGGHVKFFSRKTLEKMLTEEGFAPSGFAGTGRVPYLWKSMVVAATAE